MSMFSHKKFSLIRKRCRLTSKALAELVGVTPVQITRIERGDNIPKKETIEKIATALKYPKDFFFGNDLDELDKGSASFRSMVAMTAKERDAALAAGSLAYLLSDWVSERFELPEPDLLDLGQESEPAVAARILRQHWYLGEQPIGNMVQLLESKGLRVYSLSENTKNVDAFSCWRKNVPFIFLNTFKTAEHSRFDAAHELGHLVLHKHGGPKQGRQVEIEANDFASSFLMPEADILAKIPCITSIDQLIYAKKRWRVSVMALTYRLRKLGIISKRNYRTLCIQLSSYGYRTKEPNEIDREVSTVWKKVFTDLWNDRITKKDIAFQLKIPVDEIESLVFGLVSLPEQFEEKKENGEEFLKLRLL